MKKPIILFFIAYLIAWAIAPSGASEATLTTQAKHILMQELESNNVDKSLNKQIVCLAENIYFEARAENISGKAAVANVTKNRVFSDKWPNTWCEVVKQGPVRESWKTKQNPDLPDSERIYYPRKHKCQFSWYCDGKKDVIWANYEKTGETIEGNARAWRESVRMALAVMDLEKTFTVDDNTNGALYYYNHNLVYPYWADHMELIGVLGNHTFMK
jgi:N-acetylmuramoyl-L-alanine amidase